jgi:hypothetical protein
MYDIPHDSLWARNADWVVPGGILVVGIFVLFVIPFLKQLP